MRRATPGRLRDIIEASEAILRHRPATRNDLERDEVLQSALVHWVEIIGEAANNVAKDVRDAHAEVPWIAITSMRHRVVHEYYIVDPDILWDVVTVEVPQLVKPIEAILAELPEDHP